VIIGYNIFGVKNWRTLAALGAAPIVQQEKFFFFPKSSFRIRRTTVLGMLKDSAIILHAIRRSFFTKSTATAAIFTSVRVEFERPPLSSSSTTSLPSRNCEYHLKLLIGSEPLSHKPFVPIYWYKRLVLQY
jgi:hypothetical protein